MTSIASHQVKCDNCKTSLGDHYPKGRKNISLGLDMGVNADGYSDYKQHDFCDENCLREHLVKRTKVARATETTIGSRLLQLDVTKGSNFKPITKE